MGNAKAPKKKAALPYGKLKIVKLNVTNREDWKLQISMCLNILLAL